MSDKLKPCPFCLGQDVYVDWNYYEEVKKDLYFIRCRDCFKLNCWTEKESTTIEQWNTRTESEQLVKLEAENDKLHRNLESASNMLHEQGQVMSAQIYKLEAELNDAVSIIETLMQYGRIRPVEGVVYSAGTHTEILNQADKWLSKNRILVWDEEKRE